MTAALVPARTPVIAGPTAGGKSDLAVALALAAADRLGVRAEIVTADAFQVYRGMDIGTAKPTADEQRGVPHWLIDVIDPHQATLSQSPGLMMNAQAESAPLTHPFTVDDWLRLAHEAMADIRARGRWPIVVGGTHLYVKALIDGLFDGPEPDPALRSELQAMDPASRRAELERVDPLAAARIHPNDVRRTVRALEVFRLTGVPISRHQRQWDQPATDAASPYQLIVLDWDTEVLNRRINARVKGMIDRGLLEELRRLALEGPIASQPAEALGYKQLWHLVGPEARWPPPAAAVEEAVERIKIETRRFGKNQRTWLRRLRATPECVAISCSTPPDLDVVGQILAKFTA